MIRLVLLVDWDPIGVFEFPGTDSEYDAYVGGVLNVLQSGGDAAEIAAYLHQIEELQMELSAPSEEVRGKRRSYASEKIARNYASLYRTWERERPLSSTG